MIPQPRDVGGGRGGSEKFVPYIPSYVCTVLIVGLTRSSGGQSYSYKVTPLRN
jgi:hypothetical protein